MAKRPRNPHINNAEARPQEMYISWAGDDVTAKQQAFQQMSRAIDEYTAIERSSGRFHQDLSNLLPGISSRPGLSRSDYERFRPDEATPTFYKQVMWRCNDAYYKVGLIKEVIDLMGDFASQGLRIVHPNKRIEKFYRNWFEKVGGQERSERFLNLLYRLGNVIVRRHVARISAKAEKRLYKTSAGEEMPDPIKVNKREIPWKYTFLDPRTVDVVGGPTANFVGKPVYSMVIPEKIRRVILSPKPEEKDLIDQLPDDIKQAAKTRKPFLLPQERISVYHYKKDDWQTWSLPMIYAILDDIDLLNKLRLADSAALDGAISNIRIIKLGSLEHQIMPSAAAFSKLASIMENNVGGGVIDIIWGPDIEMLESKTQVHQFLGKEKYEPTLMAIYSGLGVPPTLTGTFGASGTTNNLVSLKTFAERLEYGRNILVDFWTKEIAIVQQAMGFRFPAKIEFDITDFGDEVSAKALLIQLADRNIISDELLQRKFKHDPDMEKVRITREHRDRKEGRAVPKAGAFHDADFELALKKIALQSGVATPSEVGLELDPRKKGEESALDLKNAQMKERQKGIPQQGRPKNSKDTKKRKEKTFKPKVRANSIELWALNAQDKIADIVNPIVLSHYQKKDLRKLTANEFATLEHMRFNTLFSLKPLSVVNEDSVLEAVNSGLSFPEAKSVYKHYVSSIAQTLDRPLVIEEKRKIQASIYTQYHGDDNV